METPQHIVCIHLGSNLGNRQKQLLQARQALAWDVGDILAVSRIFETAAWGYTQQPDFLNQALLLQTTLRPLELLVAILKIEQQMGRIRQQKWGPRSIDIDIIFYHNYILEYPQLSLPHPRMQLRAFVLIPMLDICPDWKHPIRKQSLRELWGWCQDDSEVRTWQA